MVGPFNRGTIMLDLILLGAAFGIFAALALYVHACERV